MMEWKEHVLGKLFLSDLGEEKDFTGENGEKIKLGRYAVWAPISNTERHQIVEVGSNLDLLKQKYNLEEEYVLSIKHP